MLYFYCCEITNKLVTAKSSGTVEVRKRLEKMEEFEAIREFIEKELEKNWKKILKELQIQNIFLQLLIHYKPKV